MTDLNGPQGTSWALPDGGALSPGPSLTTPGVPLVGQALPLRAPQPEDTRGPQAAPAATPSPTTGDAPDPNRRGPAYWLEELTGILPLAAPLLIEAVIHARFAEHVIGLEQPFALLFPAAIGLGAVRVAQFLDRARLRKDPTSLIRFGLYGYMLAGFALSYFYLSSYSQTTGEHLPDQVSGETLPAVIVGCAQAAGVFLWELRTRQRRREVDRVKRHLDEDRLRRTLRFPVWSWRMASWSVATGERDWSVVVAAFAPLILAQKAGQQHAKWPALDGAPTVAVEPAPEAKPEVKTRAEAAPKAKPSAPVEPEPKTDRAPTEAPEPRLAEVKQLRTRDDSLAILRRAYPGRLPSHREVFKALDTRSKSMSKALREAIQAELDQPAEDSGADDEERTG